jgi:hypothetical protein
MIDYYIALMTEAVQTSETLVNSHQSTQRYSPEDSHLQSTTKLSQATQNVLAYSGLTILALNLRMVKTILVMWGLKFRSCCRVLKCSIKRT